MRLRGWVDSEGTPIERGDIVAFNYSGNVARGIVDYVPESASRGACKILHTDKEGRVKGASQWSSGVSRVRNGVSILVLEKGEN